MKTLSHNPYRSARKQVGLTLIELMVAMVVSLIIVLAALAALIISRQGFTSVDVSSQLRDNARFAEDTLQRLGVQAGHRDLLFVASGAPASTKGLGTEEPNVFGFNNRARSSTQGWSEANATARAVGSLGYGSDILVLRFQPTRPTLTSTESDGGMIDCSGSGPKELPTDYSERVASVLHIATSSNGEPALMCTRWPEDGSGKADTQPLITGVENFQVLYGVDGIGPGNSVMPVATTADSVTDRYLRADQLTVTDAAITTANWQRVRSIRIGMVLRGPLNSAVDKATPTYYPLGTARVTSTGAVGSLFANVTNDPGTVFTPAADGRLRQVVTFTIHLRNPQGNI